MLHPVDQIIEERCEKLRRNKFLWNIIKTPIFKALNYKEAKEITDIIFSKNGFDAFSYLVEILDTSMRVEHLDFVPDKGAVLLAGNHPTGLIDGIVMFQVLKVKRPDYALYANSDLIKLAPKFTDVIIPVEWIESERTSEKSRKTLKLTKEALNNGRPLLSFSSGRLAKRMGIKLRERPWITTVIKLSLKYNVPVVPFHISARNSFLYYFLDIVNEELKNVSLFHEMLNKKKMIYRIKFGKTIQPENFVGDIVSETTSLQNYVEHVLGKPPSLLDNFK